MEIRLTFPQFARLLDEQDAPTTGSAFLEDAPAAWASLSQGHRAAILRAAGAPPTIDAGAVVLAVGDDGSGKRGLDSMLILLSWPDAVPAAGAAPDVTARALALVDPSESGVADAPEPMGAGALVEAPEPAADGGLVEAAERSPDAGLVVAQERSAGLSEATADPAAASTALVEVPEASAEPPKKKGLKGLLGKLSGKAADEGPAANEGPTTVVPPLADPDFEVIEVYPVQAPYAYIRILNHRAEHEYIYECIEPQLTEREQNILHFIEDTIVDIIEVGLAELTKESAAELLRKHFDEVVYDYSITLSSISRERIMYYILRDFLGFGVLDPIMRDEFIEDVSCDGPGVPIFLYHRKYESIRSRTMLKDDKEADSYVIRMAQRSGKHVSIADPLLDATLPDGSRLNATLSNEVTSGGSTFTIRKFREEPFTVPDLVRFGTMNEELLAYWWLAVQNGASAIYAGGTASGKTTSLNAILLFIPPQMKIVSIEDTREINLPHENWIAGVTRSGFGPRDNNGRQAGEIDMFTLLKAALRQRPEYILVGEVRGQEATALFQAMATGHTAYGTMHADSAEAVIHRLESEPISIPRSLLEALDIVSIQIQTRVGDRRVRRTKELIEIVGLDPHTREILTNEVFTWSPATDTFEFSGVSYVLERIQMERNLSEHDLKEEFERRRRIIRYMVRNNIRSLRDVGKIIATYYKDPAAVMALVDADDHERFEKAAAEAEAEAKAQAEAAAKAQAEAAAKARATAAAPNARSGRATPPAPDLSLPALPAAAEPSARRPVSLTIRETDALTDPEEEDADGAQ